MRNEGDWVEAPTRTVMCKMGVRVKTESKEKEESFVRIDELFCCIIV